MSLPEGGGVRTPFQQSLGLKALISPLGILYRLWTWTMRISYREGDGLGELKNLSQPVIIILWHNRLFLAGEWHLRFRRNRICYGLISGSRDGAWLETFYGWSGIRAIRGSRNRRGSQAARELIRVLQDGHDVGVTPDGSRGPKYQAKAGASLVAKASRSSVVLLTFSYSRAIRINSWDRFVIPLPFSKVLARTKILSYDELFDGRDLKQATEHLQKKLMEITEDCE